MAATPEMHATAERTYKAALRLPVPKCYANLHPEEWLGVVRTAVEDLTLLAMRDGCVAAAWALSVLEASAAEMMAMAQAQKGTVQ